jgi:hypothetical protein
MSFLKKLAFWKKDDFDFDTLADKEMASHGAPLQDNLGLETMQEQSAFPTQKPDLFAAQPKPIPPSEHKELELINSKLDTIKAMLVSMEQRMGQIEKTPKEEKKLW